MDKSRVRVRFAPSPTGFLHIGGLRTAFYNYLFAKHHQGDFILRIEDTDQSRKVDGALEQLLRVLKIFSLTPDEGPQLSEDGTIEEFGSFGPYVQSQRTERYREVAQKLVEQGNAYYCFCTPERLLDLKTIQQKKGLPPKYDGRCRGLSKEEIEKKREAGESYVIRLKIPRTGTLTCTDLVRGKVEFSYALVDEQVLVKSDGFPTYHLANVVDDHDMGITHVIRGEEWLPSVPKHLFLYQALGWDAPQMAHLPILLDQKRAKLSKRKGSASVDDFLSQGYHPDALLNFLLLLGWNSKTEQEIFSREEMISLFSLEQVNAAGAAVDPKKLIWMNREYLKKLSAREVEAYALIQQFLKSDVVARAHEREQQWLEFLSYIKDRLNTFAELEEQTLYFFRDPDIDAELLRKKEVDLSARAALEEAHQVLSEVERWDFDTIKQALEQHIEHKKYARGELLWPVRVALSGKPFSPGAYELLSVFPKEIVLRRIAQARDAL